MQKDKEEEEEEGLGIPPLFYGPSLSSTDDNETYFMAHSQSEHSSPTQSEQRNFKNPQINPHRFHHRTSSDISADKPLYTGKKQSPHKKRSSKKRKSQLISTMPLPNEQGSSSTHDGSGGQYGNNPGVIYQDATTSWAKNRETIHVVSDATLQKNFPKNSRGDGVTYQVYPFGNLHYKHSHITRAFTNVCVGIKNRCGVRIVA